MAKRKSKANPRKVNIKKAEDENKKKEIRIKISGPKSTVATKSNEDLLGNFPYRTRTRAGMERGGPSGSVVQSNSTLSQLKEQNVTYSSLLLDKNIGELLENQIGVAQQLGVGALAGEQTDLGEFAKAIVRFHREAQLQMNNQGYAINDGEADSAIQGGESLMERVNVEDDISRGDDAHADVDEDAEAEAEGTANVDAEAAVNVDAEAAANEITEKSINQEHLTEDYLEDDREEQPKSQSGRKKRKGRDSAALPLQTEANNSLLEVVDQEQEQHLTEAYLEEDPESLPESQQGKKKRRGRGPTTLRHLNEFNTKTRKVVEYNENGQPMGRASVELASYMGTLARYMVPITYKTWRKVPNTLKEKLWSCLEERYVLDPRSRKILISGVGDKWRSFKCNLTLNHVLPFKDDADFLASPPAKYGFLKQEHWDEFVQSRLSKTFQDLHKAQSERRGTYLFPHLLGRRNYATLAEELKKSGEMTSDDIDRSILWKKARQNKKGEYINDATREKAMIIDELKSKGTEGVLVVNDVKTDILTQALGTPEHSGRVRGVGQFVTPTAFFHTPRRGSSSYVQQLKEQHTLMESKWQEERVSRIKVEDRLKKTQDRVARLENQLGQLINQGSLPGLNFENVCSNASETSDSDNGKSTEDELFPSDPKSSHGMALGNVFQTFYTRASQILTGKGSSIPVLVNDAVFGSVIELFLDLDDIRYMCEMEDLSANCIMVYVRHLHDILVSNGMQDVYTFVNPASISQESGEDISNAITERLQTTDCQWIFVPLNSEQHWILVVINMRTMRCYWLDPLGSPDKYNIKPLINAGLKALQVDGKRRSNPIWYTVKVNICPLHKASATIPDGWVTYGADLSQCPKPSDNIQCGLYVMRCMKEIIGETPNPLLKKEPFTKLTYSKDEVDAVRLEWIQFVEKCM